MPVRKGRAMSINCCCCPNRYECEVSYPYEEPNYPVPAIPLEWKWYYYPKGIEHYVKRDYTFLQLWIRNDLYYVHFDPYFPGWYVIKDKDIENKYN